MSLKPTPKLQLGTRIDGDTLEFVEVLGVGGYGVVYRAIDVTTLEQTSYAVKCLLHSKDQRPNRRQFHIREIALHQISSAHPGIVTLHRIIEDDEYTYIIMDYAPDHDLFTQILNNCRYLGNDALIKHVFLQLVDAVEYCHSLGIYHRDLKPENILCFDNGYTVAITDFGLATTEKVSEELHTGSIYHMSPECQGGDFALDGCYSPKSNDVWSLGVILLNLATGRNPWKTATIDDLTFQTYLRDPLNFFPSVLPISLEINDILLQMLHIDWKQRITLSELRQQMEDVTSFYASDVVFEGSQARCSWEATDSSKAVRQKEPPASQGLMSYWSENSSETDFGRDIHDAPVRNLRSPQISEFLLGEQQSPKVSPDDIPEIRCHSASSSYSHQSYSSTPLTPGSHERDFRSSTMVEIVVDHAFEETISHEDDTLIETSLVPSMSSSRFLEVTGPAGVRVAEEESSWYTSDASEGVPPWGIVPKLKTSPTPKTFGLQSPTLSPDSFEWPFQTTHETDSPCSDKFGFNPMKFFSRSSRFVSPIPKDLSTTSRKARFTQETPGSSKPSVDGERGAEAPDGRRRLGRFVSARNWFLPQKFFVSTAVS